MANTIIVKNIEELNAANKNAQPGDIIVLQDEEWKNAVINLTCNGTAARPILFKAQTPGKLFFTGHSRVAIGGSYITIEGWHFKDGSAGTEDVISFRTAKNKAATHCRVTNCSINDYNEGKRLDENYWIAFYGNHNRLDHCSFLNKLNSGVLLAVMLEEESWRENYHSIDSNYFGIRPPLGSNGGEIMRVGVSGTSMYNSITTIHHNLFLDCNGEAEVISIKSGGNFIRDNVFKRCQGSLVLRHGNNNTVEHNIFYGDGKESTGGVRVINEGQWVVNNLFINCLGTGFRSPMAIMNGVPNSPVNRYLPVKDAVIANNTFRGCKSLGFGEGSDAERSAPPKNVFFVNNIINNPRDSAAIRFYEPKENSLFQNNIIYKDGPAKNNVTVEKEKAIQLLPADLQKQASSRLLYGWPENIGYYKEIQAFNNVISKIFYYTGCTPQINYERPQFKNEGIAACKNFEELKKALVSNHRHILLTGESYQFDSSLLINNPVYFTQVNPGALLFSSISKLPALLIMGKDGALAFIEVNIDLSGVKANNFILADTTGSVSRFSLSLDKSSFRNMNKDNGCLAFLRCPKSSYANSININKCLFSNNNGDLFVMNSEIENKGLYNVEEFRITSNNFENNSGTLVNLYRGGNDESTLGPKLTFASNTINRCQNPGGPLLNLNGVQYSYIETNNFLYSNTTQPIILYKDIVRANHLLRKNVLMHSGPIEKNQFVRDMENSLVNP
jgi:poly(beta-D-mannuronate) lyase